jgi:hypothetical protein
MIYFEIKANGFSIMSVLILARFFTKSGGLWVEMKKAETILIISAFVLFLFVRIIISRVGV